MNASTTRAIDGKLWIDVQAIIAWVQVHVVPYRMVRVPEAVGSWVVLRKVSFDVAVVCQDCHRTYLLAVDIDFLPVG